MIEETDAERLEAAFEMFEDGMQLQRENLQRQFPEATPAEIDAKVDAWLTTRPGAEFGDGDGVPGTWPRSVIP